MEKMTRREIDSLVRPFTNEEAKRKVGKHIIKRPGVFGDDNGSTYKITDTRDGGFSFWEKDYYHKSYKFDNIIYDYLFEDGSFIGASVLVEATT